MRNHLIFALIFTCFVFSEVARIQLTTFAGLTLLDGVIGVISCTWIARCIIQKRSFVPPHLLKPFCAIITVMILSLVVNSFILNPEQIFFSSLYIIRWAAYGLLLGVVWFLPKTTKKIVVNYMLGSGIAIVIIGFLQFFFYTNLKNIFYLGWDDHLYRLFSTFLDPNFAGMFLTVFLLFLLSFVRKSFQGDSMQQKIIWSGLSLLTFFSIILTYSRSAYSMLAVGIVLYLYLIKQKILAFASLFLVVAVIFVFSNTSVEGLNPFRTASSSARINSAQNALKIIQDHLLFGVGFNAYRYAQINYEFRNEYTPFPTHADSGTDNSFLFLFATTGIIGLLIYLYFLFCLGKHSLGRKNNQFSLVFFVSLISWCLGSFFINGFFYPSMLFWMWVLYGITEE